MKNGFMLKGTDEKLLEDGSNGERDRVNKPLPAIA